MLFGHTGRKALLHVKGTMLKQLFFQPREGVSKVASVCELCGKGPHFGMSLSHSHRRNKRRWNPNIQSVHALVNGSKKRINVCTSCIRSGKVTKAA